MRRYENRRATIPSKILCAEFWLRLNALLLSRFHIVPNHATVRRLGVNDIRISRINCGVESVTADGDVPTTVRDSLSIPRLARTGPAVVVLKSTVHVVIRLSIIEIDCVVLCDRQVADKIHRLPAIVRHVYAAIISNNEM